MKYMAPLAEVIEFESVSVLLMSIEITTGPDDDKLPDTPRPLGFDASKTINLYY